MLTTYPQMKPNMNNIEIKYQNLLSFIERGDVTYYKSNTNEHIKFFTKPLYENVFSYQF